MFLRLRPIWGPLLGLVARGRDGDLFGDVVNVAHRLQTICEPGELLISAAVATGTSARRRAELQEVGEVQVRGLPAAVHCFRYVMSPSVATVTGRG